MLLSNPHGKMGWWLSAAARHGIMCVKPRNREGPVTEIARRSFVGAAALGALAFTVEGVEVLLTPRQARAQGVALGVLTAEEAVTLEAVGETLAIGARQEGIAHFVDQQLTVPPPHALLSIRVSEVRPPYTHFYRAALAGIEHASRAQSQRGFAELSAEAQHDFVDRLRQGKIESWRGPPQPVVYATLRNDAVDVVYGTVEGFARLGVPYMPHIVPERRW
jgi:Gluconate 2-dehydrogenase subunit 3